jgi:hypothetical protein
MVLYSTSALHLTTTLLLFSLPSNKITFYVGAKVSHEPPIKVITSLVHIWRSNNVKIVFLIEHQILARSIPCIHQDMAHNMAMSLNELNNHYDNQSDVKLSHNQVN